MKKESYISRKEKKIKSIKNMPVINPISETETGSRGYILPDTYRGQPFMKNEEGEGSISSRLEKYKKRKTPYDDLKDIMIELSDNLDDNGEIVLADFSDFLIKKIAEMEKIDYVNQFNLLIKAINNSDSLDKDKKISNLVLKFNSFINNNYNKEDLQNIKMVAYQTTRAEAEEYVG